MAGTLDDRIKNVNAKMRRAYQTFGANSQYVNQMNNMLLSIFKSTNSLKKLSSGTDVTGGWNIRRSYAGKDAQQLSQLDTLVKSMETYLKNHSSDEYRKQVVEYAHSQGFKGRLNQGDMMRFNEEMRDLSDSVDSILDQLYKMRASGKSPHAEAAIAKMQQKGKKSYAELAEIRELWKEAQKRELYGDFKSEKNVMPDSIYRAIYGKEPPQEKSAIPPEVMQELVKMSADELRVVLAKYSDMVKEGIPISDVIDIEEI